MFTSTKAWTLILFVIPPISLLIFDGQIAFDEFNWMILILGVILWAHPFSAFPLPEDVPANSVVRWLVGGVGAWLLFYLMTFLRGPSVDNSDLMYIPGMLMLYLSSILFAVYACIYLVWVESKKAWKMRR